MKTIRIVLAVFSLNVLLLINIQASITDPLSKMFGFALDIDSLTYAAWQIKSLVQKNKHPDASPVLQGKSSCDLCFGQLNEACQSLFKSFTANDFETYYASLLTPSHSPTDLITMRRAILAQYNLYQFQGFIDLIIKFPEYQEHIIAVDKQLGHDIKLRKKLDSIHGFKPKELSLRIKLLAKLIPTINREVLLKNTEKADLLDLIPSFTEMPITPNTTQNNTYQKLLLQENYTLCFGNTFLQNPFKVFWQLSITQIKAMPYQLSKSRAIRHWKYINHPDYLCTLVIGLTMERYNKHCTAIETYWHEQQRLHRPVSLYRFDTENRYKQRLLDLKRTNRIFFEDKITYPLFSTRILDCSSLLKQTLMHFSFPTCAEYHSLVCGAPIHISFFIELIKLLEVVAKIRQKNSNDKYIQTLTELTMTLADTARTCCLLGFVLQAYALLDTAYILEELIEKTLSTHSLQEVASLEDKFASQALIAFSINLEDLINKSRSTFATTGMKTLLEHFDNMLHALVHGKLKLSLSTTFKDKMLKELAEQANDKLCIKIAATLLHLLSLRDQHSITAVSKFFDKLDNFLNNSGTSQHHQ